MPCTNATSPISYRVKEASSLAGISEDAIYKMISSGQLKAKKIYPAGKGRRATKGQGQRAITLVPHSELIRVFGVE